MRIRSLVKTIAEYVIATGCKLIFTVFPVKRLEPYQGGDIPEIIVSLTAIPERVDKLWLVIQSIFRQTVKPNRVVLYLAKSQFEKIIIPSKLEKLTQKGLEIVYCEDLKPHKKYFYAMQEYTEAIIITIDDDSIYPPHTIEKLIKCYQLYPDAVSCLRAHRIKYGESGAPLKYRDWEQKVVGEMYLPSKDFMAVGKGGVLYPPKILPKETFDVAKIKEYSLYADDIWLKTMEWIAGVKVVKADSGFGWCPDIPKSQKFALYLNNASGKEQSNDRNDIYMERLWKEYMSE